MIWKSEICALQVMEAPDSTASDRVVGAAMPLNSSGMFDSDGEDSLRVASYNCCQPLPVLL